MESRRSKVEHMSTGKKGKSSIGLFGPSITGDLTASVTVFFNAWVGTDGTDYPMFTYPLLSSIFHFSTQNEEQSVSIEGKK